MAYHWARLIEVLYAAERTAELCQRFEYSSRGSSKPAQTAANRAIGYRGLRSAQGNLVSCLSGKLTGDHSKTQSCGCHAA